MGRATDPEAWHRPIRLAAENYRGCRWYFVTLCAYSRKKYFRDKSAAEWLLRMLRDKSSKQAFIVRAYCLMPDHLHLLVQGSAINADLLRFMQVFKEKTTYRFWARNREELWQTSFYDHVLRDHDAPEDVAWYIWLNPVRAGLVKKAEKYPFSGPFVKGWDAGSEPKREWRPPQEDSAT